MIIRKPTKIELKVENDIQDYELFKEKLNEKLRSNRQNLARRDEMLFSNLLSGDQLKNRSYLFDSSNANESSRRLANLKTS
jgi:hypothetical protein